MEITLEELCSKIALQPEMTRRVLAFSRGFDWACAAPELEGLFQRARWDGALAALKAKLGPDGDGVKILACMLRCARETYGRCRAQGIPEQVFTDTFRCFPRFIGEHIASYGAPAFDRDWWTARQVSMELFRLGELEYETVTLDGAPAVSIHIPSDAVLTQPRLRESWARARDFFGAYRPGYRDAVWYCHSWLLEPALARVLPEGSNILGFQRSFRIGRVDYGARDFVEWVFKDPGLAPEDYPENTTLQRRLKAYLLEGGEIGEGLGYLAQDPFLPPT